MKRALAERAKQQTDEQHRAAAPPVVRNVNMGVTLSSTGATQSSPSFPQQPPRKMAKAAPQHTPNKQLQQRQQPQQQQQQQKRSNTSRSTGTTSSTTTHTHANSRTPITKKASTTPGSTKTLSSATHMKIKPPGSGRGSSKKRIRPPQSQSQSLGLDHLICQSEEDDEGHQQNAFYLKHQNKALASELFQYKHTISILEKEREVRRKECRNIAKALGRLEGIWLGMERGFINAANPATNGGTNLKANPSNGTDVIPSMASTGKGSNVEMTLSVIQSLTKLANENSPLEEFRLEHEHDHEFEEPNNHHESMPQDIVSGSKAMGTNVPDTEMEEGEVDVSATNDAAMDAGEDTNSEIYGEESEEEKSFIQSLSSSTASFSIRCERFQQLLIHLFHGHGDRTSSAGTAVATPEELQTLQEQITTLQSTCDELECQVKELSKARDEANTCERRVRRGLYRVASGRVKIQEVLKAVEKDGASSLDELDELQKDLSAASPSKSGGNESANGTETADAIILDGKVIGSNDVIEMKKNIDDLELVNNSRETRITELLEEKISQDNKINDLMVKEKSEGGTTESHVRSSPLYIEIVSKLTSAARETNELKKELEAVKDRWAQSKGDLELSNKTIEDLKEKHNRRFLELSRGKDKSNESSTSNGGGSKDKGHIDQAKRVIELEHKLKHALDNVRQSESIRVSLIDAHAMNAMLQNQIGEIKVKCEELEETRDTAAVAKKSLDLLKAAEKEGGMSKDKIYNRIKKELSSALHSKDEVKVKLEQIEKERDSLVAMNMRLQQQSVEKDDMNAKSLSTILHLKQLSEQLEQEKDILEKNLKSAQQLALAARLAANAKARVEEEAMKEKESALAESRQSRLSLESLHKEKERIGGELAIAKAQLDSSKSDSVEIRERCDKLVSEAATHVEEKRKLEEALIVAKKDAIEASKKAATAQAQARGSDSKFKTEFTSEELTIQVNQLKSRLACPVCNTRDKKVIITRCRHMFCRHCVATNLDNRNRKCPSCGLRFDKKDVEDVWF